MNKTLQKIIDLLPERPLPSLSVHGTQVILDDKPTNFDIRELVSRQIFETWGGQSIYFVQATAIRWLQFSREYFDAPHYVNNWHRGGRFSLRGHRPPTSGLLSMVLAEYGEKEKDIVLDAFKQAGISTGEMNTGAWLSIHKLGGAFDYDVAGLSADQTRDRILSDEDAFWDKGLRCLEDRRFAPTWVHGDNRNTGQREILIVSPT